MIDRLFNKKIISQKKGVGSSLAWTNLFLIWLIQTFLRTTDYWLKGVAGIRNLFLPLTLFYWREKGRKYIIPPSNKQVIKRRDI